MILSMFTLLLLVGSASALSISTDPTQNGIEIFTYEGQTQEITVSEDDGELFNLTFPSDFSDIFSLEHTGLEDTNLTTLNITLKSLPSGMEEQSMKITAENSTNSTFKDDFTLSYINSFCEYGTKNDSELEFYVNIENKGNGDDDTWELLDTIEVEVELENNFYDEDMDLDDVVFKLGLFEEDSKEDIARDMIWLSDGSEEYEFGHIDEGDSGENTFRFRVNPEEIKGRGGEYILVAKAYPYRDEGDVCVDYSGYLNDFGSSEYYAEIKIEKETRDNEKMVIFDEESYTSFLEVSCNERVTFKGDVWNVGNIDFEDQILVTLENTELGIDEEEVLFGDLDEGSKREFSFTFDVPLDADEETYYLNMRVYYDFEEGEGTYKNNYEEISDSLFVVRLKIEGGCVYATSENTGVSASLESGVKAGEDLVVKSTVKNEGDKTSDYAVEVKGYSQWASLLEISPSSFTLSPGESQEIEMTFNIKEDAEGDESFSLDVSSEGYLILEQPVEFSIEPMASLSKLTGGAITEDNWHLWGIGVFNIILVVMIIIVSVRLVRRAE